METRLKKTVLLESPKKSSSSKNKFITFATKPSPRKFANEVKKIQLCKQFISQIKPEYKVIWNNKDVTPKTFLSKNKQLSLFNLQDFDSVSIMDDVPQTLINQPVEEEIEQIERPENYYKEVTPEPKTPSFIKILLKETDNIFLYESASCAVPADTEDAILVQDDNKLYEYLTKGKGKNRRRTDAEAQTVNILYKSRSVNTYGIKKQSTGTFVSNYDMFDTYAELERSTKSLEITEESKIDVTTYSKEGKEDLCEALQKNKKFKLSSLIIQRLLAGNIFQEKQKRFRNMYLPNPLDPNIKYNYRLETLWIYKIMQILGKAVVCASWCKTNNDLLAIGYGAYYYVEFQDRLSGYVCVWSIKNPVNPERIYKYGFPVTAVAFSTDNPQLLAVGLYDGSIEIRDITDDSGPPVAKSDRTKSPVFHPISQIEWIEGEGIFKEYGQILATSQDARIMKYSFTSGPYLLGHEQLRLNLVEGVVEGLSIAKNSNQLEADRHPQVICLTIHPVKKDIYYVGTDDGSVHKCSINHPHHHTGVFQAHNGYVNCIQYSPWSPKIFLTCGNDWYIRIWIEDIYKPILELSCGLSAINCAFWSPIHSTVIASCTKNDVQLWDIRRKKLKPASVRELGDSSDLLTIIKFSNCGRSIIVGNTKGTTFVCALEDMPFIPYFQYAELERALYQALDANPELLKQVKSLGNLGYPTDNRTH